MMGERGALVDRMRRASTAIYAATEAAVADDISAMLRQAADLLAREHPEPEMEYEVTYASNSSTTVDGHPIRRTSGVMSDLAKAREFAAIARDPLLRERTKAVPAGPWVPVGEGEQG